MIVRRGRTLGLSTLLVGLLVAVPALAAERALTFEERVRAQEAIERLYYGHQVGATRPFEEAVPRSLIEAKVRKYLRESLALERFWEEPIGAAELRKCAAPRVFARSRA